MLIRLDDSIRDLSTPLTDAHEEAIDLLARVHRTGQHYVVGRKSTFSHLMDFDFLSGLAKKTLHSLYHKSTFDQELFNSNFDGLRIVHNVPHIWSDGIYRLADLISMELSPTSLMGENLEDAEFFRSCGELFLLGNQLNMRINCVAVAGGGSTTYQVLDDKLSSRFLVLCILDSDKRHPSCQLGDTAKKCQRVSRKHSQFHKLIVMKDVREIENLIGKKILELATENEEIENIELSIDLNSCSVAYFDFKFGLKKHDLLSSAECDQHWNSLIKPASPAKMELENNCNLQCESRQSCTCILIPGLGEGVLKSVNKFIKEQHLHRIAHLFSGPKYFLIENLGEAVAEWCMAPTRMAL